MPRSRHLVGNGRRLDMSRRRCRLRLIDECTPPEGAKDMKYVLLIYHSPGLRGAARGGAQRADGRVRHVQRGAQRVGRVRRRRGAGRPAQREDGARPRRRAGDHRRAVRRGQGAAGRLLRRRVREHRAGHRDRRARPGLAALGDRGAADHGRGRARRCDAGPASRICCASWRRRCSACSSAATGASTPARTPSRRRCWRPRCSGRDDGVPENPRGWLITVASRRLADAAAQRGRRGAAARTRPRRWRRPTRPSRRRPATSRRRRRTTR